MSDEKDRNEYRDGVSEVVREGFWTLPRIGLLLAAAIIFISALGFVLSSVGLIGRTVVERTVFEQSYQRSAAEEQRFNTLNAELTAVEARLRAGNLTETQRADLEAQAAGLRFQINQMGE